VEIRWRIEFRQKIVPRTPQAADAARRHRGNERAAVHVVMRSWRGRFRAAMSAVANVVASGAGFVRRSRGAPDALMLWDGGHVLVRAAGRIAEKDTQFCVFPAKFLAVQRRPI